jgi:uncharacterized protein DUF3375
MAGKGEVEPLVDYGTLEALRRNHPGWRLLAADHAPLVVSFLYRTFIRPNLRSIAQPELASRLEDYLYHLRERLGEDSFPRSADRYLDDWASDTQAWLRKYYPADSDEAHFDITPAAESVIEWLASLDQPPFVGTESRLLTVVELLRQIVEGTQSDPQARIADLERRKQEIDAQIEQIRDGQLDVLDPTRVKERFLQVAQTARGLLADFRAVEQNFRVLDRAVRERIATWGGSKGDLLQEIFTEREAITGSDQGRSFQAFWDFLMAPTRQEELSDLLRAVFTLDAVKALEPDPRLLRVHYDWLEAGEVTQRTVARLSAQLRRYLDDQAYLENRRIMQLIRDIEQNALAVKGEVLADFIMDLDETGPAIDLVMDRPLFAPPAQARIDSDLPQEEGELVPVDALFAQNHVDKARLENHIRRALQTRAQVSLTDLVEAQPIEQGLAELVAYLSLAADDEAAIIDDRERRTVVWEDEEGRRRQAVLPLVIFARTVKAGEPAGRSDG